jgi:crossover junction endodeoxyribonuclease RusA
MQLPKLTGNLSVQIDLYPPDRRMRDCDNSIKSVLDAMEHAGVYDNDSQIKVLRVEMLASQPPGRAVIRITKLRSR